MSMIQELNQRQVGLSPSNATEAASSISAAWMTPVRSPRLVATLNVTRIRLYPEENAADLMVGGSRVLTMGTLNGLPETWEELRAMLILMVSMGFHLSVEHTVVPLPATTGNETVPTLTLKAVICDRMSTALPNKSTQRMQSGRAASDNTEWRGPLTTQLLARTAPTATLAISGEEARGRRDEASRTWTVYVPLRVSSSGTVYKPWPSAVE
mmetsp:Transcript_7276/g.16621  ORF Transcript_7276/g.16621 Transcript_7276/m.16621 type:complete len:211 (-) Transcript_7276:5841-6473(-)